VHKFEANGQKFMVVTIDISAGTDVVAWANNVISQNPDRRVILDTHAYLYDGGERFNNAPDPDNPGKTFDQSRDELLRVGSGPDAIYNGAVYGGQDGETLWNSLVRNHANVSLFLSGHQFEDFDEFKYHLENGDHGNPVYELLVDPQNMANGGNGWIRLLEFDPNGTTVHVKTYSPYLNQWDTAPDNFYDIELSPMYTADINNDGSVDAADYVSWRKNNGPQARYDVWRSNFGEPAGGGSRSGANVNIPEPTTLMLLIVAIACIELRRCRLAGRVSLSSRRDTL
jgi:hypothetical protein